MTSIYDKIKNLSKKQKTSLMGLGVFLVIALICCIKNTYAYYHTETDKPLTIVQNQIGDFGLNEADINMVIYKELNSGVFTQTYSVPSIGYKFDNTKTKCTNPDDHSTVACTYNGTGNCNYTYAESSRTFTLTSNQRVTCRFYFTQTEASDINIYTMIEDQDGTETYSGKKYSLVNEIPAYGYKYLESKCTNPTESVNYNPEIRKFTVSTKTKNDCKAYFIKDGDADIITNVYVETSLDSHEYNLVDSIPVNHTYKISTDSGRKTACTDKSGNNGSTPTYENGYINIESIGNRQECNIFLELIQ